MRIRDSFYTFFGRSREQTVGFSTLIHQIWTIRKALVKWEISGILIGLVICFSIPKEYTTTIKLIPEKCVPTIEIQGVSESILSMLMNSGEDPDAYSKKLYALLVDSPDFFYDILDLEFEDESHALYSVRELLSEELRHPWWYYITQYPLGLLEDFFSGSSEKTGSKFMPTAEDVELITALKKRVMLSEIENTGMLELEVQMQDPLVAAVLADTISTRLERLLTDYRMEKYVNKVEYTKRRVVESGYQYHLLQDSLANYQDTHHKLIHRGDKVVGERLKLDRDIAFNVYSLSRMEEQAAQAKLLDNKSAFYTVEEARMAVKASSPKKLVILSYAIFLSAFIPVMQTIWRRPAHSR